jgi:polyhydroxybutyrate depolymerase
MHTKQFVSILILSFLLAACRKPQLGQDLTETLNHDGIERTYHIILPSDFSTEEPSPLVIALHGGGGQGSQFDQGATQGTLTAAADERGVVLVFPEGVDKQWCDGRFAQLDIERQCDTVDDVAFISEIIDDMIQNYGIDPTRVYATGISNGGFMSVRLAIDLSEKIAAVAPVAAQLSVALEGKSPQLPIPIMIINGTEDPLVPFDGGDVRLFESGRSRGEVLSTAVTIEHFRQHNNCDSTPQLVDLPDTDPDDGTTVTVETYTGCDDGAEVILVKVIGGGHAWPGGKQYLGPKLVGVVSHEINASEMILDFFLEHAR